MIGYGFHPEAYEDLEQIHEYIAQDSLERADRFVRRIFELVDSLTEFPNQGHRRTDLTSEALRFQSFGEYLIAYAPDESPLWVVAVLHGRRAPQTLAAILSSRRE